MTTQIKRGSDFHRPRRPNPDTINYLRSLPLDVEVANQEISRFLDAGDSSEEFPAMFCAAISAIDEIRNEIASLAGEEHAAEIIETLARIAAPFSELVARKLLFSVLGYSLHLATHRYGSHVLQTILQLAVRSKFKVDLALHNEAPDVVHEEELPSLIELIVSIWEEVEPHAIDLSTHICGSHVIRTLICILSGVDVESDSPERDLFRRGRVKSKNKKTKEPVSGNSASMRMVYTGNGRIDPSNDSIHECLRRITASLSGESVKAPGDLQHLACDSSAGPTLITLLRSLTYRDAKQEWREKLEKWDEKMSSGADHHLGLLRPEPKYHLNSEAHRLAQRLLCWTPDNSKWAGDVVFGLAGEARGSHCLEALLQTSPDEFYNTIIEVGDFCSISTLKDYVEHDVSNFVIQTLLATVRNAEQAEKLIVGIRPLILSGYVLDPAKRRRGIYWRVVECARKFRVLQGNVLEDTKDGFKALGNYPGIKSFANCVPLLLQLALPDKDGDRLKLDVPGTRSVFHALHFDPRYCDDVLKGVLMMPKEHLELLAKSGLGSRCIFDAMFEGQVTKPPLSQALSELLYKLSGRLAALSADRVGHHVVTKLFHSLGMDDKEKLVLELSNGKNRLTGNSMGRNVLDECAVREYESNGKKEWQKVIRKQQEKRHWLDSMTVDKVEADGKKKRKRKSRDAASESKAAKTTGLTISDIVDAVSIPATTKKVK